MKKKSSLLLLILIICSSIFAICDDDESTPASKKLIIFNSSEDSQGSFTSENHQTYCTTANTTQNLNLTTVKPFISTTGNNIKDIADAPTDREVKSPNGTAIASDWASLWDSSIENSLEDAGISFSQDAWWSGSNNDGTSSATNCSNWTSIASGVYGFMALKGSTTGQWISWAGSACSNTKDLLCVGWN